ncbi:MAG: RidA family protein [Chloroflexi bacterium]|nr:RidA family protein [Chloroflexota bacterium]
MAFESVPFGDVAGQNAMRMPVAFCNALAIDAAKLERLVWVAGQLAVDEQNQLVGKGDIRRQTEQVLENVKTALERLGGRMEDVVQVTVFVKDMASLHEIHEVRLRYFSPPYPTSTLVAVSGFVDPDALIEINAMAAIPKR